MTDSEEQMSIGDFARRTGLTASALRFYDDSGVLRPSSVDPVSGYRRYRVAQCERAIRLRRLREIGMPLTEVQTLLDDESVDAARRIDGHLDRMAGEMAQARRIADDLKAALTGDAIDVVTVSGPVLGAALEHVMSASVRASEFPVLNAVRVEVDDVAITLTATDRYRLSTRTVMPLNAPSSPVDAVIDADDLRAAVPDLIRSARVAMQSDSGGIRFVVGDGRAVRCRGRDEEYPDHRILLDGLGEVQTRVVVAKSLLQQAVERCSSESVLLACDGAALTISGDDAATAATLPAEVNGSSVQIVFALTTFYPAVATVIGADVILDIRGDAEPITVRSADCGDLTTVVMPMAPADSQTGAEVAP